MQNTEPKPATLTGASARTRDLMVRTAVDLMQRGKTPSVSEAAEAAAVSRATAYRYFLTQSALIEAVVDHALGPILEWDSTSDDPEARVMTGHLEGSNVSATATLVQMIEASRSWDTQLKLISSARDMDSATTDLMRLPD